MAVLNGRQDAVMPAMIPAGTARFIRRRHVTAVAIAAALARPVIVCHPSPPLAARGIAIRASVCLLVRARLANANFYAVRPGSYRNSLK